MTVADILIKMGELKKVQSAENLREFNKLLDNLTDEERKKMKEFSKLLQEVI